MQPPGPSSERTQTSTAPPATGERRQRGVPGRVDGLPLFLQRSPPRDTAGVLTVQRQQDDDSPESLAQWRPTPADPAVIDQLLAADSPVWQQLNPHGQSTLNCPATAAAVDHYLATGDIDPAERGDPLGRFDVVDRLSPPVPLPILLGVVSEPNTFVVVQAARNLQAAQEHNLTPHHWFVLLNRGGSIVVLDAYGPSPGNRGPLGPYAAQQGFISYRYYRGRFRVTFVSFDDPDAILGP
jgi:hypothetical protein